MNEIQSEIRVRVRYSETDRMGVAYHSRYLEWFEAGRTELFRELGLPYIEMEERGILLPVVEANVQYKRSAVYDDLLTIITTVSELPRSVINFHYSVYNSHESEVLATGKTKHCFLKKNGKPARIPDFFKDLLREKFNEIE